MPTQSSQPPQPGQNAQTILVFGDSLSAGYGIARERSWPVLLAKRLQDERYPYVVANASISGEPSRGGLSRLPAALRQFKPAIVIIALGANDGLQGLSIESLRANLRSMIRLCQASQSQVVLVGMRLPPNYGNSYAQQFHQLYADLAKQQAKEANRKIALAPFLFEGFADRRDAFQDDNVHPTTIAQPMMLDNVWRALKPLLKKP